MQLLAGSRICRRRDSAPSPSLKLNEGEMAVVITADLDSYQKRRDNKSVRKTVSIPQWMAEEAEKRNISLSKTLQDSLKVRLAD